MHIPLKQECADAYAMSINRTHHIYVRGVVSKERDWVVMNMQDREKFIFIRKATKKDVLSHVHLSVMNISRYMEML